MQKRLVLRLLSHRRPVTVLVFSMLILLIPIGSWLAGDVEKGQGSHMTSQQAIAAANQAATAKGWTLSQYQSPSAALSGGLWSVLYKGVSLRPGDHFLVTVNDQSGATQVIAGR